MKKSSIFFSLLLIFVLLLGATYVVEAGTTVSFGAVAGIPSWAEKGINQGGSNWSAYVWSHSASSIGTIGYRWRTVRQKCPDGSYPAGFTLGGNVSYGDDSYYDSAVLNYVACTTYPYTKTLQNLGVHDFKESTDVWTPEVNRIENR
jgi:hypothetical protein